METEGKEGEKRKRSKIKRKEKKKKWSLVRELSSRTSNNLWSIHSSY